MRNPQGWLLIEGGKVGSKVNYGKLFCDTIKSEKQEADTFQCFHCQKVVFVLPKMSPENLGGLCKHCMKLICPACVDKGCVPFEAKIEQAEQKDYLRRQYEKVM